MTQMQKEALFIAAFAAAAFLVVGFINAKLVGAGICFALSVIGFFVAKGLFEKKNGGNYTQIIVGSGMLIVGIIKLIAS